MIKVREKIRTVITVPWEANAVNPPIDTDGYILEDGSTVVYVYGSWEVAGKVYEPVLENGEIIGFEPTEGIRAD